MSTWEPTPVIVFLREYGLLVLGFICGATIKFSWLVHKSDAVEIQIKVDGVKLK